MNNQKEKYYFNINIPHDDKISVRGSPTPAVFSTVRNQSLLKNNTRDYNMSVVRFTIPTTYIPIQFFPVIPNPTDLSDVNYSIFAITLRYQGIDYTEHLRWIPQNKDAPIPPPPQQGNSFYPNPIYAEYYSLYSFNHFVYILNTAIKKCFDLRILPLLNPTQGKTYNAPLFQFDGSTFLFSAFVSDLFLESTGNKVELFFNTALNTNFDTSFNTEFYDFTVPYKNVRYVFMPYLETNRIIDTTEESGFLYKYQQEFDTTGQITSFRNIIIRSNTIPIRSEGLTTQTGTNSSEIQNILTDFEIDQGSLRNQKSFIHYIPTAEYRRINLTGDSPLQNISLEILWGDRFDNFYPVLIPAHDKASVKLYFEEI